MHAWIDLTVGSNLKNWNHNNDLKVLEINERERLFVGLVAAMMNA